MTWLASLKEGERILLQEQTTALHMPSAQGRSRAGQGEKRLPSPCFLEKALLRTYCDAHEVRQGRNQSMFILPLGLHDMADSWGKRRWLQWGLQLYAKPKTGRNLEVFWSRQLCWGGSYSLVSIVVIFSGILCSSCKTQPLLTLNYINLQLNKLCQNKVNRYYNN